VTFDEAFDRLIGHEGAFSKDPQDDGNWTGGQQGVGELKGTKYGIAANTYPDLDIERLTLADAKAIYYRDWWLKAGGGQLSGAVMYQLWVFAVNAGMSTAKRHLQKAIGLSEDGVIGPVTVAKVRSMDENDVLMKFLAACIRFYTARSRWPRFGAGWMNRVAGQLDYAALDNPEYAKPKPL
jgi:lysozyme family protein